MDLSILTTEGCETGRITAESDLDLSNLPDGRYAVPGGVSRLKVLVKRPKADSKWHGWIFVSDAAEYGNRQKYGNQRPGHYYHGKIVDQLKVIAADPAAATIAYGKITGHCGVCGLPLENPDSVKRGIGPVCASKMGY